MEFSRLLAGIAQNPQFINLYEVQFLFFLKKEENNNLLHMFIMKTK